MCVYIYIYTYVYMYIYIIHRYEKCIQKDSRWRSIKIAQGMNENPQHRAIAHVK